MTTALSTYMRQPEIVQRFAAIWGTYQAEAYIASVLLKVANSPDLKECSPQSITTSALRAAALRLHCDLDQAYLVPFKGNCTMITGYRGLYDMALRTNQYRFINVATTSAGTTVNLDPFTGAASLDNETGAPAGVVASFQLMNGFSKSVYMTLPEIHAHAAQYSKSYTNPKAPWKLHTAKMERKTVFRRLMLEWGIMSPFDRQMIETEEEQETDSSLPTVIEGAATTTQKNQSQALKELGF